MYASFLRISRALHPDVFEQPVKATFSTTCSTLMHHSKKMQGRPAGLAPACIPVNAYIRLCA
jgi:hypothetical protein